jgi:signal transduction histidine kinase
MNQILRVLYAEDDRADADLTQAHLAVNAPGIELEIVDTGQGCLSRLAERTYDVLLLDNHLPDMDGIDVLKQMALRHLSVPVVMVTGTGDEALVVQVLRLGASDYVPKRGSYLETLSAVLRQAASGLRRDGGGAQQRRILYVERHAADIDLTVRHFEEAAPHLVLVPVQLAEDALTVLQNGGIDLVLADLRTTDLDALDLLRAARRLGLHVPFIVVTGQGDEQAAIAALKLGASDYLVKRQDYLTQLPYAIENAIARAQLVRANEHLKAELAERERLGRENARLLEDTRAALSARDEFLAIAAHEIRGPLTAMRLAIQSLQRGAVAPHQLSSVLDVIGREDRKLAGFVDELLDLAHIRARTLEFAIEPVDLETVVRQVVDRFGPELARAGSTVSVTVEGNVVGRWDRARLDQIVTNLVSNAIKFGLGRPIDVTITGEDASVQLRVTDQGTGIAKDRQEQIFQPFERAVSGRTYGGLGLGLHVAESIVHGFGGRLDLLSEPDTGSTFTMVLPKAGPL